MNREESLKLLKEHVSKENLLKHMYAVEAIMKETAEFLKEDQEKWRLVGLLHDIDFEKCPEPEKHCTLAPDILKDVLDEEMIKTIRTHNFDNLGMKPETKMELGLIAADAISGLLIAAALMMPSKKIADVKVETVSKKFKQKDFARNCNRDLILFCEQIGIPREKFFELSLRALQKISNELGL
jgi:putative nucleotidyltransferase with HDIG domain